MTKLDASGNVVYSTYFGGNSDDSARAMTVDRAGNVYVTGSTASLDFPTTKGAYASTGGSSFLFRLNPDGSVGYSTYFTGATPAVLAVDAAGSVYMGGASPGNLPVTPGAYQTNCNCNPIPTGFFTVFQESGFLTKFDPSGSSLLYSTYLGGTVEISNQIVNALALASDGSAYVASPVGIYRLNPTGSALLASAPPTVNALAMALGPDGSLYVGGTSGSGTNQFHATAGAFEPVAGPPTTLAQSGTFPSAAVEKLDAQLAGVQAATYFGGSYDQIKNMTVDSAGNVYIGGSTGPQGLPTRTPFQGGFSTTTGFLSELSGDLSTLLFPAYLGDAGLLLYGRSGGRAQRKCRGRGSDRATGHRQRWTDEHLREQPGTDAASGSANRFGGECSEFPGWSGVGSRDDCHRGSGSSGSDAQLLIGGAAVAPISMTPTLIIAVVPQNASGAAVQFQVQSGGGKSNSVVMPVGAASPGIFSQNGNGYGQGYILNKDGSLNTPSNPAAPGDNITIFATGAGPISFNQGYAVTAFPVTVLIDGFYADGVDAVLTPVKRVSGRRFQITVIVPNPGIYGGDQSESGEL